MEVLGGGRHDEVHLEQDGGLHVDVVKRAAEVYYSAGGLAAAAGVSGELGQEPGLRPQIYLYGSH